MDKPCGTTTPREVQVEQMQHSQDSNHHAGDNCEPDDEEGVLVQNMLWYFAQKLVIVGDLKLDVLRTFPHLAETERWKQLLAWFREMAPPCDDLNGIVDGRWNLSYWLMSSSWKSNFFSGYFLLVHDEPL